MTDTCSSTRVPTAPAAPNGLPSLQLVDVGFHADDKTLLNTVSLTIPRRSSTMLLGPNGAGKSLLLRICHGLLKPHWGKVLTPASSETGRPGSQAMVFQRPVLLRRSVEDNLTYGLAIKGIPRRDWNSRVEQALELVGLSALKKRQARVLSGGEQQRLALARAWSLEPEILFLDEPTASLDPAATRAIERIIGRIHAEGTTIVMATHDLGQARRLANRILFLHQGSIVEDSPATVFFSAPQTTRARAFLAGELVL